MKQLKLKPLMTVEESDKLAGKLLAQSDCLTLFREDVDIYDKETGKCLAKFRKGIIPGNVQVEAFSNLLKAAGGTSNRGVGTGLVEGEGKKVKKRLNLKSGKVSKTNVAVGGVVQSGIIGYFDRTPRVPSCRLTAFTQKHFEKFKKAYPIIKFVDTQYASLMPEYYKKQRALADKTSQDFVIKGTAFTTVTVNKNWQTAVHKDKGDFAEGFGNLTALRKGTFTGGHLVLPRWGVGFDIQNGDLLMMDVHQWHGNTPIVKDDKNAVRLSLVMYYREKMIHCKTMKEELRRVQTRKIGTNLNPDE